MATGIYQVFNTGVLTGQYNESAVNIFIALTSGYTPNFSTDTDFYTDVQQTGHEVSATGYGTGGINILPTVALSGNVATWTNSGPVQWTNSSITATGAVIYQNAFPGTSGTPLILFIDFGGSIVSSSNTFQVSWSGNIIQTLT